LLERAAIDQGPAIVRQLDLEVGLEQLTNGDGPQDRAVATGEAVLQLVEGEMRAGAEHRDQSPAFRVVENGLELVVEPGFLGERLGQPGFPGVKTVQLRHVDAR
jgi:hypothetical protein